MDLSFLIKKEARKLRASFLVTFYGFTKSEIKGKIPFIPGKIYQVRIILQRLCESRFSYAPLDLSAGLRCEGTTGRTK
ncbi:MAG: hypothetical protein K0S60_547 [Evtepia sp.]|nr:hypothetical protein [Evtepia sp.]